MGHARLAKARMTSEMVALIVNSTNTPMCSKRTVAVNAVLRGCIHGLSLDIDQAVIPVQLAKQRLKTVLGAKDAQPEQFDQQGVPPVVLANPLGELMRNSLRVFPAKQVQLHLKIVCPACARLVYTTVTTQHTSSFDLVLLTSVLRL